MTPNELHAIASGDIPADCTELLLYCRTRLLETHSAFIENDKLYLDLSSDFARRVVNYVAIATNRPQIVQQAYENPQWVSISQWIPEAALARLMLKLNEVSTQSHPSFLDRFAAKCTEAAIAKEKHGA